MGCLKNCVVPGTEPAGRNQPCKLGIAAGKGRTEALHLCQLFSSCLGAQAFGDTPLLSSCSGLLPFRLPILLALRALPHPLLSRALLLIAVEWMDPATKHLSWLARSPLTCLGRTAVSIWWKEMKNQPACPRLYIRPPQNLPLPLFPGSLCPGQAQCLLFA